MSIRARGKVIWKATGEDMTDMRSQEDSSSNGRVVRVANGQAFWGDWREAPRRLVRSGEIDYLTMDYLAEITMSLLHKQRQRRPELGYPSDFVALVREILPECRERGVRIVTNAGGLNPEAVERQS